MYRGGWTIQNSFYFLIFICRVRRTVRTVLQCTCTLYILHFYKKFIHFCSTSPVLCLIPSQFYISKSNEKDSTRPCAPNFISGVASTRSSDGAAAAEAEATLPCPPPDARLFIAAASAVVLGPADAREFPTAAKFTLESTLKFAAHKSSSELLAESLLVGTAGGGSAATSPTPPEPPAAILPRWCRGGGACAFDVLAAPANNFVRSCADAFGDVFSMVIPSRP
jgi:hypothetical protein